MEVRGIMKFFKNLPYRDQEVSEAGQVSLRRVLSVQLIAAPVAVADVGRPHWKRNRSRCL